MPFRFLLPSSSIVRCLAAALALSACAPVVATRGNLVDEDRLAEIREGASTRADVTNLLGTPTTVGTFDPNVWYYIGQRTEQTAFFEPEITERRILKLRFNDAGVVESAEQLGLDDAQAIELVDRETPTLGRRMTVLEQLIGNFGRFNTAE